jgi:hypothetical protein
MGATMIDREQALIDFYFAERQAGTEPLIANERMHFFAKQLDAVEAAFEQDLNVIRQCMERA